MVKLTQKFKPHSLKASHKVSMMDFPEFLQKKKKRE